MTLTFIIAKSNRHSVGDVVDVTPTKFIFSGPLPLPGACLGLIRLGKWGNLLEFFLFRPEEKSNSSPGRHERVLITTIPRLPNNDVVNINICCHNFSGHVLIPNFDWVAQEHRSVWKIPSREESSTWPTGQQASGLARDSLPDLVNIIAQITS